MSLKLALIDADSLLYQSSKEYLEESIKIIDEKIQNILIKTDCDYYCLFLSSKTTFRHTIYPEYKANRRKYKSPLKWVKVLREYIIEKYKACSMLNVEADDLVAYYYINPVYITKHEMIKGFYLEKNKFDGIEYNKLDPIICSPDKDLLNNFAGNHFNYSYYLEEDNKPETLVEGYWDKSFFQNSNKFLLQQLVVGDAADNVKGIEGKGIKFWEDIQGTSEITVDGSICELDVLLLYIKKYGESQGIFEFQKNYRVLYILRTDEDFIREVGTLPIEPDFQINNSKLIF